MNNWFVKINKTNNPDKNILFLYIFSSTCDIKCVYGYGLKSRDGTLTSSTITCKHDENYWKPHGFYDCLRKYFHYKLFH